MTFFSSAVVVVVDNGIRVIVVADGIVVEGGTFVFVIVDVFKQEAMKLRPSGQGGAVSSIPPPPPPTQNQGDCVLC